MDKDEKNIITKVKWMLEDEEQVIFFWGAGDACKKYLKSFKYKKKVCGIIDRSCKGIGDKIEEIPVLPIEYIKKFKKRPIVVVVTTGTPESYYEIRKKLQTYGITMVVSCMHLLDYSPLCQLVGIHRAFSINELKNVENFKVNLDKESVRTINEIVNLRNDSDWDYSKIAHDSNDQYFDSEIVTLTEKEVFFDIGAYCGDSLKSFISKVGHWEKIYCFEPDVDNYKRLLDFGKLIDNIEIRNEAVGKNNEVCRFQSGLTHGSHVDKNGDQCVKMISLDSIECCPTFIKMDIEGVEYDALLGAENIIKKCKPTLAICVYHKSNDLWEIPLLVKKMVPEYNIYIRHYSNTVWDTIMYATIDK